MDSITRTNTIQPNTTDTRSPGGATNDRELSQPLPGESRFNGFKAFNTSDEHKLLPVHDRGAITDSTHRTGEAGAPKKLSEYKKDVLSSGSVEEWKNGLEYLYNACKKEMTKVVNQLLFIGVRPGAAATLNLSQLELNPQVSGLFNHQSLQPLQLTCALTVRKCLIDNRVKTKQGLQLSIDNLPLPTCLKRYVHTYAP